MAKEAEKKTTKESAKKAAPAAKKAAAPAKKAAAPKKAGSAKVQAENFYGTGRRKSAIAKVWVYKGNGNIEVNNKTVDAFFCSERLARTVRLPLAQFKMDQGYDVKITTNGGGLVGQAEAAQLGIARAILAMNEEFRKNLREEGLLTRDARVKERKKYGRKRARKGFQYRKR